MTDSTPDLRPPWYKTNDLSDTYSSAPSLPVANPNTPDGIEVWSTERRFVLKSPLIDRYTLVTPTGEAIAKHARRVDALGAGGFGAVVRAVDMIGIPRALKLVARPSIPDQTDLIRREVELTNAAPYKHVVAVIDHGPLDRADPEGYYFVSPYVAGRPLDDFFCQLFTIAALGQFSPKVIAGVRDAALFVIRDVLAGATELDDACVVHLDLKPNNILVYPRPPLLGRDATPRDALSALERTYRAFVIDLGCAKPTTAPTWPRTRLVTTPYFFPLHWLSALDHRESDGSISYVALLRCWREIDLYAIGRTLEKLLLDRTRRRSPNFTVTPDLRDTEPAKERFWQRIFGREFEFVEGLIHGLLGGAIPGIKTAPTALKRFRALPLRSASGILESELLTDRASLVSINTGQDTVRLSGPFPSVVDHPTFQRLRRIQQLMMLSEIFPEATHTRFTHSLRAFQMAKTFVLGLLRKSEFALVFQRQDVDRLLAAALLHDVGQYHFSHSIEDLKKLGDRVPGSALSQIQHDQDLAASACRAAGVAGITIAGLLEDYGIAPEEVYYVIRKDERTSRSDVLNLSRDMVAGAIDCDRVSYLYHDSERTGVPYGRAIDLSALVEALTIWVDPHAPEGRRARLAVEERGVSAAEAVLVAAYWMYSNVYWHYQNRMFMAALKRVVKRGLETGIMTFAEYLAATWGMSDVEALRWLSGVAERMRSASALHRNPLRALVDLQRLDYRRVLTISADRDPEIFNRLTNDLSPAREEEMVTALERSFGGSPGDVLVDVPLKKRFSGSGDAADTAREVDRRNDVLVRLWRVSKPGDDPVVPLVQYSGLAGGLSALEDRVGRKLRVFVSREALDSWSGTSSRASAAHTSVGVLTDILSGWEGRLPQM